LEIGSPSVVWLGVPLNSRGQTIGVMAVQDYREPAAYGEEEKQLLTFVAEQTVLAMQRKEAEQALRESENKFKALFMASSQGVLLHDEEKYLEVNPAAVRIMGYASAEGILGKHPRDTSPPTQPNGRSSAELARAHIQDCLQKGSTRFEWVARSGSGADVPLEVTLTAIPMGGRRIIQAVIQDISERKQAEAELHKALAREKELSALKTSFVSLVSHEFRTPLGIILSSAEILDDYLDQLDPEERRQHLESIQGSTRRMAALMEEVLLIGRLDAGRMDFRPTPIDLRTLCRRWVDEVKSATEDRCPIELDVERAPAEMQGDESLLQHIFTNLLTNAVKYSEPGRPVRFSVSSVDGEVVCEVSDQGIGIPEADRATIFTAFRRGSNVGTRPGTGLGLVIVKRCVELHQAQLRVTSQPGQGTTMTVRFNGALS
jgi:PAS domain S-box-containing protein